MAFQVQMIIRIKEQTRNEIIDCSLLILYFGSLSNRLVNFLKTFGTVTPDSSYSAGHNIKSNYKE
jgi:hypothetical protein